MDGQFGGATGSISSVYHTENECIQPGDATQITNSDSKPFTFVPQAEDRTGSIRPSNEMLKIVRSQAMRDYIWKQHHPSSAGSRESEGCRKPQQLFTQSLRKFRLIQRSSKPPRRTTSVQTWFQRHSAGADGLVYPVPQSIPASLGRHLDPFHSFAPNLRPESQSLILYYRQIYSMNSPAVNFPRDCFLDSEPDLAWFHSILYIVSADYDVKLGTPDSALSLHHGSEAYKCINIALQEAFIRDTTIAAVALLASREGICSNFDLSELHMRGLERMVKMRGGIQNIKGIHGNVVAWCDFCYSNIRNSQPRFSRLNEMFLGDSVDASYAPATESPALESVISIDLAIAAVLRSLQLVSSSSNPVIIGMQIYNIEYDLLMLNEGSLTATNSDRRPSSEVAALKAAAHLYLYLVLRKLPSGSPIFSELIIRLKTALIQQDEIWWNSCKERMVWRLWILFMGYAAAAERAEKWWFVQATLPICGTLEITSELMLYNVLRTTVWQELSCDRWTKSLWRDCCICRDIQTEALLT